MKTTLCLVGSLLAGLLACPPAGAAAEAPAPTQGPTGTFQGVVVDADTSAPIAGAVLRLYSSLNQFLASAVTPADGSFQFVVPAGSYRLFAWAAGHGGQNFPNDACATDASGLPLCGLSSTLLAQDQTLVTDFSLPLAGGVAGTLRDEATGQPLANANVLLWITHGTLSYQRTDSLGHYEFFSVMEGSHHLTTSHGGAGYLDESYPDTLCPTGLPFDCNPSSGDAFSVTAGNVTQLQDMALRTRSLFLDGFESGNTAAWSLSQP